MTTVLYEINDGVLSLVRAEEWAAIGHAVDVLSSAATIGEIRAAGLTELQDWVHSAVEDDIDPSIPSDPVSRTAWEQCDFAYAKDLARLPDDHPWDGDRFLDAWEDSGLVPWNADWFGEWVPIALEDYGAVGGASPGGHVDTFRPTDPMTFLDALEAAGFIPVHQQGLGSW